jgi:hypothetical protein
MLDSGLSKAGDKAPCTDKGFGKGNGLAEMPTFDLFVGNTV